MVACAAMFAFAACETDNTGEGTNNGGNNNGGTGSKTELATPALEIKDVTSTSFTVTWAAVENAGTYIVTVGDGQPQTVTETSFKLEKLNAGTYKGTVVAMPADSKKYKNSKPATFEQAVTGLTPEEATWVQCKASLPTEEDAAAGYFPYESIFHSFKGTGIVEIKNGAFVAEDYKAMSLAELANECEALKAEAVAKANDKGATVVFSPVQAETEYIVVAVITNEEGLSVIFSENITTTKATPHPALESYVGTWEIATTKKLMISKQFELSMVEESATTKVTVEALPDLGPVYVAITGLSVAIPEMPALGQVGTDTDGNDYLQILNYEVVGANEEEGYYLVWNTWGYAHVYAMDENGEYILDADGNPTFEDDYYLIAGNYPSFTITDGVSKAYEGYLDEKGVQTFKAEAMDIYAYTKDGKLAGFFYDITEDGSEFVNDIYLTAGVQNWKRISTEVENEDPAPATFGKMVNNRQMFPATMHSYVAM